jgi:site-specific DNA-methyltransferase (adenine-specific)
MNVAKAITGLESGHGSNSGAIRRATMGDAHVPSGRLGNRDGAGRRDTGLNEHELELTESAKTWDGWGTALKPAFEPIVVARKPLAGTVAANVLAYGTGALNIDACRVGTMGGTKALAGSVPNKLNAIYGEGLGGNPTDPDAVLGRFPPNVLLDESQAGALDEQSGVLTSGLMKARTERQPRPGGKIYGADKRNIVAGDFAGSGTTGEAALLEGMEVDLIELEAPHLPLILQRVRKPLQPSMFGDWEMSA